MIPKQPSRVFAVAFKDYIELRKSTKPPMVKTSVLTKNRTYDEPYARWEVDPEAPWIGHYVAEQRTEKIKIPIFTFCGGRTVGQTIRRRTFAKWTGHLLQPGTVWEINPAAVDEIISRSRR